MKILVVLPRFPYPLEKGDKLRAYHQIAELSKRHDVYLFCVSHNAVLPEHIRAIEGMCKKVCVVKLNRLSCYLNVVKNWFASKSLQMGYWNTSHAKHMCRIFARQVAPDVIYNQMVRTMPLVARLDCPKVMDFQDALSMNTERRMERSKGLWRYILHFEFKMLRSSEYNAFRLFDRLTIISETDRDAIPHRNGGTIRIVRNGVDLDYFKPQNAAKEHDVVFCGNMQYRPNIDAAHFLVDEIMPLVWQRHPEAKVVLAGATPKGTVRRLEEPRVAVTGSVDDIRPYYAKAKVCVAPMRIGSGLQNKLLEAMAIGTPCVTTPLANEALGATDGEHLLLGTTAAELADRICRLLDDADLREALANRGHEYVSRHFSWASTGIQLEQILQEAVEERKQS